MESLVPLVSSISLLGLFAVLLLDFLDSHLVGRAKNSSEDLGGALLFRGGMQRGGFGRGVDGCLFFFACALGLGLGLGLVLSSASVLGSALARAALVLVLVLVLARLALGLG